MNNREQFEILADIAFESKNYKQAYEYYSKLLENDAINKRYWIGKGLSAGYLSTLDEDKTFETITCIKTANKLNKFTSEENISISRELVKIGNLNIEQGIKYIDQAIENEFNALQIPTGTFHEIHKLRKINIISQVGQKYRTALTNNYDLLVLAAELNPTRDNYQNIIDMMNLAFEHSSNKPLGYFGALNELTEENMKIKKIWDNSVEKLKEIVPNIKIVNKSPIVKEKNTSSNSGSGCFIATAATGSYNHPTVLELRRFRDETLQRYELGKKFIQFYYKYSPSIAYYIKDKYVLRKLIYYVFIKPLSVLIKIFD